MYRGEDPLSEAPRGTPSIRTWVLVDITGSHNSHYVNSIKRGSLRGGFRQLAQDASVYDIDSVRRQELRNLDTGV